MTPWPRTSITFVSDDDGPTHLSRSVHINGTPVLVADDGVSISQPSADGVQRVTLTLLPTEMHFTGPVPEPVRVVDWQFNEAEDDKPVPRPATQEVLDEALAKALHDTARSDGGWHEVARAAREHIESEDRRIGTLSGGDVTGEELMRDAIDRAVQAERDRDEAQKELRMRELHHFEEEQKRVKAEAHLEQVKAALVATRDRAEKAEAERDEAREAWDEWKESSRAGHAHASDMAEAAAGWRAKHAALRADVEALLHGQRPTTGLGICLANALNCDAARDPQADPDTVTLRREDVEDILDFWVRNAGYPNADAVARRVRAALGWGDEA